MPLLTSRPGAICQCMHRCWLPGFDNESEGFVHRVLQPYYAPSFSELSPYSEAEMK